MKQAEAAAIPAKHELPAASRSSWPAAIGLIIAVGIVYANTLRTPFLFDDADAILNNPTIQRLASWDVLKPPSDGSATTGRPLVNLSFAINYSLSGENVWSYHAFNGVIHAFAGLALMALIRRTLLTEVLRERFGRNAQALAFFCALLWLVHPLQTESVTCIAQRTESLCGLFYLLTFYAFARGANASVAEARMRTRWLGASVFFCLLGMGSKEVMVTAPLLVLLYDRTFFSGSFGTALRTRTAFHGALALTWLLLLSLVLIGGGQRGVAAGHGLGVSGWSYLLKQCEAIVLYLKLSFWPSPLVLDYGTKVTGSIGEVWWQGLIVLGLLGVTGWALRRRPVIGFAGAWFFLILAPSSSFVPLVTQTVAEHRMYLPLAAIVVLVVMAAYRHFGTKAWTILGAGAAGFAMLTVVRNHDYRSALGIWNDTVNKNPGSARAQANLGVELFRIGRGEDAIARFEQAIRLRPDHVSAHYNLGVALLDRARATEAISEFESAIRLAPDHPDARLNLGNALVLAKRTAEAVPHFEAALALRPAADAHYNLAVALIELERYRAAVENLHAALKMDANLPNAHYQLGRVADLTGDPVSAKKHYETALTLARDHVPSHRRLGMIFARNNQLDAAADHFRAVIRLEPRDADAYANLGNVLLIQGHPRDAVPLYEQALRLRPEDMRTRENLQVARESSR
ncbi:MAG TPA: tetratricopeptide repeat protein [Opitutaceae bacterium]|nr:tetratricopeptide repeat protein [Opitutaceae bacterium]